MCGIIGIWAKNKTGELQFEKLPNALKSISHRGPDNQSIKSYSNLVLGHARLSIIDLNESANQPMSDLTGRYHLVFNGEIYNYLELRQLLEYEGVNFTSQSDTEVLLHLLINKGEEALSKLNGFFSFIFFDQQEDQVLFARDRIGIKPLIIYEDEEKIILTSELQALFNFDIDKGIESNSLSQYFKLSYIPAPSAILNHAYKIKPGQMGVINAEGLNLKSYYKIERRPLARMSFDAAAEELKSRLTIAVKDRLVSDVPLGTFLSGGVDSSVISAIAKRQKKDLKTFSIGFDHPYFNESNYARMVAEHIKSDHHEFVLTKKDFKENFHDFLDSIDEPFGDSSAFAMYLLAKETKKHVTVALSGDGADELFAGYRKHRAELRLRMMSNTRKAAIKSFVSLFKKAKVSRSDKWGDVNRKLQKFTAGFELDEEERYFEWASFATNEEVEALLKSKWFVQSSRKGMSLDTMSDYLIADQRLVLPNDMLKKVDLMSMQHALEVRTPFLDHRVVEFANSLPIDYKMDTKIGKLVLKQAFRDMLPNEILLRKKQGFEVPLQEWLGSEISALLDSDLFSQEYIEEQGIFQFEYINRLLKSVKSNDFGEKIYVLWSLIIFQYWHNKHYNL